MTTIPRNETGEENPNLQPAITDKVSGIHCLDSTDSKPKASYPDDSVLADFPFLRYPMKIWKLLETDNFSSIWWDDDCVVIDKDLFLKEVLERKDPFPLFATARWNTFCHQLKAYGFYKILWIPSETHQTTHKWSAWKHPNFQRGSPHLLPLVKTRVRIRNSQQFLPKEDLRTDNSKKRKDTVELQEETQDKDKVNMLGAVGCPTSSSTCTCTQSAATHHESMNVIAPSIKRSRVDTDISVSFIENMLHSWMNTCETFLQMLMNEPAEDTILHYVFQPPMFHEYCKGTYICGKAKPSTSTLQKK